MALLDSEIYRIKALLGLNTLQVGAEPYVGHQSFFEIIRAYMQAGALTSSNTEVQASAAPAPVPLVVADGTGFAPLARVWVDQGEAQESSTVDSVSGQVVTLRLRKVHSGTYPVTVDGGEAIVREYLAEIARVEGEMKQISGTGSLKRADDVEFYQVGPGFRSQFEALERQQQYWVARLGSLFGVDAGDLQGSGGGSAAAVY